MKNRDTPKTLRDLKEQWERDVRALAAEDPDWVKELLARLK